MRTRDRCAARALALLLAIWPVASRAAEGDKRPLKHDQILVSAQLVDNSGATGGIMEIDWIHPIVPRFTLVAGASYSEIGDARLWFGRVGGGGSVGPRTSIEGEIDLGEVQEGGTGFGYRAARVYLTQLLVPGRLELIAEDRFLDIGAAQGNLLKVGFGITTATIGAVGVAYQGTLSGNLGSWAVIARYDFRLRGIGYLMGASVGRSITSSSPLLPAVPTSSSSELFAGVRLPVGDQEITLILDSIGTGSTRRNSIYAGFRIRL